MSDAIWLRSYPPGVPKTIDPDAYPSLHALLLDACWRYGERPAFDCLSATITYAEWERDSRAFADFLREEAECQPGDRIAIMLPNVLAYPVTFLGALRAGLIVVNVNPLYTPRELEHQLKDSGATIIVIMENFAHKLATMIDKTPIKHVVVARLGDLVPPLERWAFNFANKYIRHAVPDWDFDALHHAAGRLRAAAEFAFTRMRRPAASAPALLQYTGGTTGVPKGAILSHRNLVANTLQCRAWIGMHVQPASERVLTPLPLYHIFSLTANMLTFASLGGLNVLVPDPRDLRRLMSTMARTNVTAMSGVNTLFNALVNAPDFAKLDFRALKFAIGGGAAVQRSVATRWRQITELGAGRRLRPHRSLARGLHQSDLGEPKIGSVGLPVPSTEVTIRDDHGQCPPARRDRRGVGARAAGDAGLLGPPGRNQAGAHGRRLAEDRRHRHDRSARVS